MKRFIVLAAALLLAATSVNAQSIFEGLKRSEYQITKSESMGGSVKLSGDVVVGYTSGKMSGTITFNSKTKTIKFTDRSILYEPENLEVEQFENSCLTSAKAILLDDGGEVTFQIIEDYKKQSINFLVQWPDYSASRIFADFKRSKDLK